MKNKGFFDEEFAEHEQIPRHFSVMFNEVSRGEKGEVCVTLNGSSQLGDIINDNSYNNDFYRYHDIFHYSFAALLGWSPCTRSMMKRKRKSNKIIDEIEDGARATITEEALSLIIFNEAKRNNYFENSTKVSQKTLQTIKEMTENFEVKVISRKQWERTILKAYEIFRTLIKNKGGEVEFDASNKEIRYFELSN